MLKIASFLPHPPIIIPTIGSPLDLRKVDRTVSSLKKIAKIYAEIRPETIIVVSPHAPLSPELFLFNSSKNLLGQFLQFGDFETHLAFKNDLELLEEILSSLKKENIPCGIIESKELDHGTLVPLYYLREKINFKLISFSYSLLPREAHFKLGKVLQKVIKNSSKKIAFIASGDLSHCLTYDAPGGFSPRGKEFDQKIIKFLEERKVKEILNLNEGLVEEAGECGFRSLLILLGILDGIGWKAEIFSYEAPFGVGYLVANF
ncbi:MAG: MEMO1 family protein [Candidatus Pacebacteria bacterium]|nr:MEMO1 family protein [Candidatus Paceibacterota bacterium]